MSFRFLAKLGAKLARPSADWTSYSRKQHSLNFLVLAILAVVALSGFWEPISDYFLSTFHSRPKIETPSRLWNVQFGALTTCELDHRCDFASENSSLWESPLRLSDKDHFKEVRIEKNKNFWVGIKIDKKDLDFALVSKAHVFVIGYINAEFRVFVNGELRATGDGRDYLPISILLNPSDLRSQRHLFLAIEIKQTLGSARPIVVDAPYVNGLFTTSDFRSFRDNYIFGMIIRPMALGIAAVLAAIAFFCLWLSVRDRNEYFLFAIYMICLFSSQLLAWGNMKHGMDRNDWYQLDLNLRVFEGLAAALVGVSYARLRVSVYFWVLFASSLVALSMHKSSTLGSDFLYLSQSVGTHFVPCCFLFGALACISQAEFGKRVGFSRMPSQKQSLRINQLYLFSALNAALAVVYFIGAQKIVTINATVVWHRPIQYCLVALLGGFLFRDFREFDVKLQKVASSRFHNPLSKEQKVLRGYLVAIDLKKSSKLYDLSAQLGLATKIPTLWCEAATEIIELKGGHRLSSAGDSLIAFFEGEDIDEFYRAVTSLKEVARIGGEYLQYGGTVNFRAGIIQSSIRPIYKKVGRKMHEDYEDGPGDTGFKNLMRILDTEKEHDFSESSVLVVSGSQHLLPEDFLKILKKETLLVRDVGTKELVYLDLNSNQHCLRDAKAA